MKIIVINGVARSGKDSFVNACMKSTYNDVYSISSIDKIKELAKQIGWDGKKDERGRRLLSDLKDALTLYDDIPFKTIIKEINNILFTYSQFEQPTDNIIIFVFSREPEEIQRWVDEYNAKTLLIRRDVEEEFDNHADRNVFNFDYDYVYSNIHDLKQLEKDAINFIDFIGKSKWSSKGPELRI